MLTSLVIKAKETHLIRYAQLNGQSGLVRMLLKDCLQMGLQQRGIHWNSNHASCQVPIATAVLLLGLLMLLPLLLPPLLPF